MEESMKGAFTTTESDAKNKTLSKDDEIENDFMTSWKITNRIDEMDFTSETSSLAGKRNFDFDKLDDFEFGDFGKMSSFKIDMSNLDFSSPQRKKEKGKEISDKDPVNEQRNGKQGVFSFNFDFNELEGFGLDANLMKGEKNFDNITTKKRLDYCDKIAIDHDSKSKSGTCISGREKDLKGINKLDNATSDVSGDMISHDDVDVACNSAPTASKNNCTTNIFPVDQKVTTADQGNKAKDMQKEEHKEQSNISVDEKLNTAMVPQVLFVQSTGKLAPGAPPDNQIGSEVIDLQDHKSDNKKHKSMESLGSHDSRNSTSENALNLQHATERCNSDASNVVALHYQCDASKNGPSDNKMDQIINAGNTSVPSVSIKPACLAENEDQHSLGPKTLPSLRSSNAQRTFLKGSFLKPLSGETKQSTQVLQKVSVSNILNAEVKEKTEQVFHRINPSKPLNGELPRKRLTFSEDDKHKKENLVSATTKQTNACMNSRNSMAKLGELAHIRPPKANSVKSNGLSTVTYDARYAISRFSSNTNMPNTSNQKRSNFKSISDINAATNLGKSPKLVSTESTERHATLTPSLKRKSYEGSIAEIASLRSSKRSSVSPTGKSCAVDTSPRTNVQMVLNSEACRVDTSPVPQSSSFDIPPVTSITDPDVSLILEDDGNVQKAEACIKELEEICSMLKKKQEEAKELVVRAVVNNNFLLMLNHPVHEEKIRKLQKFASSLVSKDYNF